MADVLSLTCRKLRAGEGGAMLLAQFGMSQPIRATLTVRKAKDDYGRTRHPVNSLCNGESDPIVR